MPLITVSKFMKQKLKDLQGEIKKYIIKLEGLLKMFI